MGVETSPQRGGAPMVDGEPLGAELRREPPHRGEDEMQSLTVPTAGADLRVALDQEDPNLPRATPRERTGVASQLIAQDPHGVHRQKLRPRRAGPVVDAVVDAGRLSR